MPYKKWNKKARYRKLKQFIKTILVKKKGKYTFLTAFKLKNYFLNENLNLKFLFLFLFLIFNFLFNFIKKIHILIKHCKKNTYFN